VAALRGFIASVDARRDELSVATAATAFDEGGENPCDAGEGDAARLIASAALTFSLRNSSLFLDLWRAVAHEALAAKAEAAAAAGAAAALAAQAAAASGEAVADGLSSCEGPRSSSSSSKALTRARRF